MADLFPAAMAAASAGALTTAGTADAPEVVFGRSWKFDYRLGDFVRTPTGKLAPSEGTDAWLEWCAKALQTERYKYIAYSREYGQEFDSLIGSSLPRSAIESEIARIATEALMIDPRTASVGGFGFDWSADQCTFTCTVTSVREDTGTVQGSVVTTV